jgi:hypothetical protein
VRPAFATSAEAVGYLGEGGINIGNVHLVGNTTIDTLKACLGKLDADKARTAMALNDWYIVATLHRPANVDNPGTPPPSGWKPDGTPCSPIAGTSGTAGWPPRSRP